MRKLPCVTPRASVEIRGVYGQPVFEFFQQVKAILALNGSDKDLGQFFAEPQLNAAKGEIYWYSDVPGPVQPYSQLSEGARRALDDEVLEIRRRIRMAGERFAAEGGSASGNRTEMFKAMMSATDLERCLFLVGTQPVLCAWGCKPIGTGASPVDLWSYAAATTERGDMHQPSEPVAGGASAMVAPRAVPIESEGTDAPHAIDAATPFSVEVTPAPEKLTNDVPHAVLRNPVVSNKVGSASAKDRPSALPRIANVPIREVSSTTRDASRYRDIDPARRSFDFWDLLKKLIIAALLLFLVLLLLRGCGDNHPAFPGGNTFDRKEDESRLRKEIVALRRVADEVLANCPVRK
jgi:hypothetical protein